MKTSEAIATRRSVRAFLNCPVDEAVIRRVVEQAGRAPSGGNVQPWHVYVMQGEPLARLKAVVGTRAADMPRGEGTEYDIYPRSMPKRYNQRRFEVGEAMYASVGIDRGDRDARRRWFQRNFRFFDAPMALFCYVNRCMGPPQWADVGMYLQSVMLLLREAGLDSCPQECWALFPRTVAELTGAPADQMLFAGMAIGHADLDHSVNRFSAGRAPVAEYATFLGFAPS